MLTRLLHRSSHQRRLLRLCPLLLLTPLAFAQATYIVSGTVTSALDNHPLQHATVELLATETENVVQTTTSDELGRFTFPAVPRGAFALRGDSPGFLPTLLQQHDGFSTAVVTGASVPTDNLKLPLEPLGSISGTVTDEFAEPVRNAIVHLVRRDDSAGDNRLVSAAQLQTNDLGHYSLGRLAPGTYFLAVTASPWYAVHPTGYTPPGIIGVVPYRDPALDVAYPVTYFPAAYDAAHASPIEIHGNQARADLQLSPTPALTLTFPRDPNNTNTPIPQLEATVFGHPTFAGSQSEQTPERTTISGLPPGDYILRTSTLIPLPEGRGSVYHPGPNTPLHLSRDTPAAPALPSSNIAQVHITIRSADGQALPTNLQVGLVSSSSAESQPRAFNSRSSPHQIDTQTQPGDYYFVVTGAPAFYLREISLAGKPLPSNDLHLAPGSSLDCTVVVARGTHTLRGFVQSATRPVAGAMLLLIPADQHLPPRTWYRQQSDLDGSFSIENVPPGPYLLLALDDPAWKRDWRSIDFLSRQLPHATPIFVPEKPPAEIALPEPVAIQPL